MRSRLVGLSVLFTLLALGPEISAAPDLDVGVPPGTPLDWDEELNQPTPVTVIGTGGPSCPQPNAEKGSGTRLAVNKPVKPASTPAPTAE